MGVGVGMGEKQREGPQGQVRACANSEHLCSKLGVKEASKRMGEVAQWAVLEPTQTLIPTTPTGADSSMWVLRIQNGAAAEYHYKFYSETHLLFFFVVF